MANEGAGLLLKVARPVFVLGLLVLTLLAIAGNQVWIRIQMLPVLLILWVVAAILANRSLSRPKS